jgi:hypothetical protein
MICWWCSKKLTNIFGKPVEGVAVTLPGGLHQVRVHKMCSYDAGEYLHGTKITAQPSDVPPSRKA